MAAPGRESGRGIVSHAPFFSRAAAFHGGVIGFDREDAKRGSKGFERGGV